MLNEIDNVQCPLLGRQIELGYCMDIQYVVDELIKPDILEDDISKNKYPICQNCPKRKDPAA